MSRITYLLRIVMMCGIAVNAVAANVSTLYVDDAGGRADRTFEVKNTSNTVEYITLSVERRTEDSNGKILTVPMTNLAEQEILVSPAYFILQPNSQQTVRITPLLEKGDTEQLYYIAVNPKLPPLTSEQPQASVRMISAYKVLYLMRPKKPLTDYSLNVVEGKHLQLINRGNTSILMHAIHGCPTQDAPMNLCQALNGERVMPNQSFTLKESSETAIGYWVDMQLAGGLKHEWIPIPKNESAQ